MSEHICMHYYISGKVQGVWFRASTKAQADQLHLTGWVRNLPDGRVEVLVCGEKAHVATLYEWLKTGPRLAQVSQVLGEEKPFAEYVGFTVK